MSLSMNSGVDFSFGVGGSEFVPTIPPLPMRFRVLTASGRPIASNNTREGAKKTAIAAGLVGYRIEPIVAKAKDENDEE